MAAFCNCCGAEIGLKAEACPVCGTPQHGMIPSGGVSELLSLNEGKVAGEELNYGACCWIDNKTE